MSRYCIGIDLGTTNTVVDYIDNDLDKPEPQIFKIPQITDIGEVSDKET